MPERKIDWYRTALDKETLGSLTRRSDWRGLAQALSHLGLITLSGWFAYHAAHHLSWPFVILAFFLHGTFMSFNGVGAACHELCHGTPFRTRRLNELFLCVFAFLSWTNPAWFRASHGRHHQYTLHPPRDLEVVLPSSKLRPVDWLMLFTVNPRDFYGVLKTHVRYARGIVQGRWDLHIFPESNPAARRALFNWSRFQLVSHAALAVLFVALGEWILVPILLPPLYCTWLATLCGVPQHKGMQSCVADFRRSCRTVLQDPITTFLYWRMNYHIEHHMYAGVPFFNLRKLHALVRKDGGPLPNRGLIDAWREIFAIDREQAEHPGVALDAFSRGQPGGLAFVPQEANPARE